MGLRLGDTVVDGGGAIVAAPDLMHSGSHGDEMGFFFGLITPRLYFF